MPAPQKWSQSILIAPWWLHQFNAFVSQILWLHFCTVGESVDVHLYLPSVVQSSSCSSNISPVVTTSLQVWSSTGTPPLEPCGPLDLTVNWILYSCTRTGAWLSPTAAASTAACTTASCSTQREPHSGRTSSTLILTIRRTRNRRTRNRRTRNRRTRNRRTRNRRTRNRRTRNRTAAAGRSGSGETLRLKRRRSRQELQMESLQQLWQRLCCWPRCWDSALELWAELMFSGTLSSSCGSHRDSYILCSMIL